MENEKRLIDANRALEIVRAQGHKHPNAYHLTNYATLILQEAPTVDAVEVVRCKDCKHFKPAHFKADDGTETPWDETFSWDGRSDGIYHGGKCKHDRNTAYGQKDMAFRKPEDFCSYGERREGE